MKDTQILFNKITCNGTREMTFERFKDALEEYTSSLPKESAEGVLNKYTPIAMASDMPCYSKSDVLDFAINIFNQFVPISEEEKNGYREQGWDAAITEATNKAGMHAASVCSLLNQSGQKNHVKAEYLSSFLPKKT